MRQFLESDIRGAETEYPRIYCDRAEILSCLRMKKV
jgi:hypothetical protein